MYLEDYSRWNGWREGCGVEEEFEPGGCGYRERFLLESVKRGGSEESGTLYTSGRYTSGEGIVILGEEGGK